MPPLWDWHCAGYLIKTQNPWSSWLSLWRWWEVVAFDHSHTAHTWVWKQSLPWPHPDFLHCAGLFTWNIPIAHPLALAFPSTWASITDQWSSVCLPGEAYMSVTMRPSAFPLTHRAGTSLPSVHSNRWWMTADFTSVSFLAVSMLGLAIPFLTGPLS